MRLKYVTLAGILALALVLQAKFSDFVAKEIDFSRRQLDSCEREISILKQNISAAQENMNIKDYARARKLDFVNLEKDQIVLSRNDKNNTYRIQNEKRNIVEQIMLSFTE
jgi:hypothetical protein